MWVIAQGTELGFRCYGPFGSKDEATIWANTHHGFQGFSTYETYDVVELRK